jgi:hypothetical protein
MASKKMYGKSPRIAPEPAEGDTVDSGGGAPDAAAEAAEATAGAPEAQGDMQEGPAPKGNVMAGTDGIPTSHHTQAMERTEMHHRHEHEHLMHSMGHHHEEKAEMHRRHEKERRQMHRRHEDADDESEGEMRAADRSDKSGPTGGMKEKSEGKAGTEK